MVEKGRGAARRTIAVVSLSDRWVTGVALAPKDPEYLGGRFDRNAGELAQVEQMGVSGSHPIGFGRNGTLQDSVVVRIFLDDLQMGRRTHDTGVMNHIPDEGGDIRLLQLEFRIAKDSPQFIDQLGRCRELYLPGSTQVVETMRRPTPGDC